MPWTVSWTVFVDGQDMTSPMQPYLISITVADKDGTVSDTCQLVFDDAGGQIKLPQPGSSVVVYLQGVKVFEGKTDVPRFSLNRGGGRTLSVSAKGFDAKGKVKEPQSFHLDDASLQDYLDKAAQTAGISSVKIDPAFEGIQRDYWSADADSFLHIGQRLARELHGTFKIRGDKAVLAKRGADAGLPTIRGVIPGNVLSCEIAPITTRRTFKQASVRYFDRPAAAWKVKDVDTGIEGADATNSVRTAAADEAQAGEMAEGRKGEAEREGGEGTVELDLTVEAQAEALFILSGARPGVDGTYRIAGVTHKADRGGGSTTSLELKQPSAGAGQDGRADKGSGL